MNKIVSSNNIIKVYGQSVIVNGKIYPKPKGRGCHIIVKNSYIIINMREFINGRWVITPRAIWHSIF